MASTLFLWLALAPLAAHPAPPAGLEARAARDPWPALRRARLEAALERTGPRARALRLGAFPGPGGRPTELFLTRVTVLAPDATARVMTPDGEQRLAPSVSVWSARLAGGGRGLVAWSPGAGLSGGLAAADGAPLLGEPATGETDPPPLLDCVLEEAPGADGPLPVAERAAPLALEVGELFVECDLEYRALFETDQEALDYAVLLLSVVSDIYRRDLGIVLSVPDGNLRLWTVTPPWGTYQGKQDFDAFRSWWQSAANPLSDETRANVHLLTGPPWGGISGGAGGVCSSYYAYGVSGLIRSYVGPLQHTSRENWDVFVLSHELGHSFGSLHTEDYSPPIECGDGTGPDLGTIMSNCHLVTGSVREIGMRFHPRVQEVIRSVVALRSCFASRPLDPGDWDGDGDLDGADLAALEGCLEQGFFSAGCTETFDLDGNGRLDDRDRQELVRRAGLQPAALALYGCRNPAGSLVHLDGRPTPGGTVTLGVDNPAGTQTPGSRPVLLVALAPDPRFPCGGTLAGFGMTGGTGELLVAPATRVASLAGAPWSGPGTPAPVALELPADAGLLGLDLYVQGLLVDPFGPRTFGLAEAYELSIGL